MRQFVSETPLEEGGSLTVEGKKFHYLAGVLRSAVGDMVYVRLPSGELQQMTVSKIDSAKKQILLNIAGEETKIQSVNKAAPVEKSNGLELWLFQFAAKGPKMDLIVRQAVECGVKYIVPVQGEFCQKSALESAKKKSGEKESRWSRIITEAREQSGSAVNTEVLETVSVEQACEMWKKLCADEKRSCLGVVLYEQTAGTMTMHEAAAKNEKAKDGMLLTGAVVCGAEGGISNNEVKTLQNGGFIPVHFATNILRCETASLYGTAALQTVLLEKEKWQFRE